MALKGLEKLRADMASAQKAFDGLRAKASALFFVEQQAKAAAYGVEGMRESSKNTTVGITNLWKATQAGGKAAGKSIGLAKHELLNLGYQANDVFVSLASGQSPLLVLVQQGSQVGQVLAGSRGGVIGAMKQLRDVVFSLKGGFASLGVAGLGAVGYFAYQATKALEVDKLAADDLEKANVERRKSLTAYAENLLAARAINKADADKLKDEIAKEITRSGPQDTTNPQAESDRIRQITVRLMNQFKNTVTDPGLRKAMDDLSFAQLANKTAENAGRYEDQLDKLKLQLSDETIDIQTYEEKAAAAETKRTEAVAYELNAQIGLLGRRMDAYAKDATERTQLETQMTELIGQREAEERAHQRNLLDIAETGRIEREKQGKKTIEDQKKILAELNKLSLQEAALQTGLAKQQLLRINEAPGATNEARRRARLQAAPVAVDAIGSNIQAYQDAASRTEDESARLQYQERINELLKEQAEIQNQLSEDTARGSFMGNLKLDAIELANRWENLNRTMSTTVIDTVNASVTGLAGALTSVIMGTQKAGAAFAQFGISLLTNFIAAILQAILWATVAIPILTALGILSGGSTVGTGLGITLGALAAGTAASAGITGREAGGSMVAGIPHIVGEKRPEIVVPKVDSMVYSSPSAYENTMASRTAGENQQSRSGRSANYLVDDRRRAQRERLRRGDYDAEIVELHERRRTELGV